MVSACARGHCVGCETCFAKGFDDRFAGAVQIVMLFCCERGDMTTRPVIKPRGELSMLVAKEGPL
jgi:hypothetical protein